MWKMYLTGFNIRINLLLFHVSTLAMQLYIVMCKNDLLLVLESCNRYKVLFYHHLLQCFISSRYEATRFDHSVVTLHTSHVRILHYMEIILQFQYK